MLEKTSKNVPGDSLDWADVFQIGPLLWQAQLPGTIVAKYNGHKNVITKSKQKNRAYFWTIPFLVKYTGSKEKQTVQTGMITVPRY